MIITITACIKKSIKKITKIIIKPAYSTNRKMIMIKMMFDNNNNNNQDIFYRSCIKWLIVCLVTMLLYQFYKIIKKKTQY